MKNFLKFLLLVIVLSAGVSLLYDYQLHHGKLSLTNRAQPEKYTLADRDAVDQKSIASLAALSDERRKLVAGVIPAVVSVKTTKRIARRPGLDPFDFFLQACCPLFANRVPGHHADPVAFRCNPYDEAFRCTGGGVTHHVLNSFDCNSQEPSLC